MKKRLFRNLLILCLLLITLTAAVSAAVSAATEPAKIVFYDDTYANNGRIITFTFEASFHCPYGNIDTPVMDTSTYKVVRIDSWTSKQIKFQIKVSSVYCQGKDMNHVSHKVDTIVTPSRTVEFNGEDLCHKTLNLTAEIKNVVGDNPNDALKFTVTANAPRYELIAHPKANPTCTEYGYSQLCYECPGCGKFFADENATTELIVSAVRRDMTPHNYVNGECTVCHATGEAYTLSSDGSKNYHTTVEEALTAAYTSKDPSVWITHYARKDVITLTDSCNVYVCNGVTIPKICTSASDSQAAININITNHGTIKTIAPASSGAQSWEITNYGSITEKIGIPDNASLSMEITNNGTITLLDAKKPITLLSGIGTYGWISTVYPKFTLGALLGDGCKFYLYEDNKQWKGREYKIYGSTYLIVSEPPFSASVTGPTGLQTDGSGGYSLTLAAEDVQNKTLSTSLSYPDANSSLSSEGANFTYGWYYTGADTASWTTTELPLNELAVGVNHLTLRVTDDRYNYTHSINVTVTITSTDAEPISLKVPEGPFTKMYDGTDSVPKNLTIGFVDSKGAPVPLTVDTDYTIVTEAYNSPNCKEAKTITVTVALTTEAAKIYDLKKKTFTVNGTITKFKPEEFIPFFYLHVKNSRPNVGARIMDYLTETNVEFTRASYYDKILDPLGANPNITYYRMRSENIYDPTTDEKITENSIFTYEGSYTIYAVIGETANYAELLTEWTTLTANSAFSSHTHCRYGHKDCAEDLLTYTGFSGSSLSPDGSSNQRSYYLNAAKSTVNLSLILRQLRDNSSETPSLDLCLYGKTLRADSEYAEQFRVSNKWHLTLTDCVGTGVLKGTSVDDEHGGCLYVADATVDISNIKITGGSSSKLGGAIVVDDKGVLNIHGGEISGNTVTSGNGGAIYIRSGGTVNLYDGTIRDNHVYSGKGGAIYVEAGGTLNLYGGTITGNTASTHGGGIYVEKGGTLNIHGAPVVTKNTADGKTSNIYLAGGQVLRIDGEMESGAKLGIGVEAVSYPALFASSANNLSAYFTSDDPNAVVLYLNETLTLCTRPTAALTGSTLTVTTGSDLSENVKLLVAEYDANGKMLAAQVQDLQPERTSYTLTVKNPKAVIRCLLLRSDDTALLAAFGPLA